MYSKLLTRRTFSTSSYGAPSKLSYVHGTTTTPLQGLHTSELLRKQAQTFANKEFVVSRHQNIRWTYDEVNKRTDEVSQGLLSLGLEMGDRVGIYSPNRAEWVLAHQACARAGLILVNVNPAFQSDELDYALNKVEIKTLIMPPSHKKSNYINIVNQSVPNLASQDPFEIKSDKFPNLKNVVLISDKEEKGMLTWDQMLKNATQREVEKMHHNESLISFEDVTNIQFTSGTTGFPKGAALTHHGLLNNAYFCGELQEWSENDRVAICSPMYHTLGIVCGQLSSLSHGATMVFATESFDVQELVPVMEQEKTTAIVCVPTMLIALLEHVAKSTQKYDLGPLRTGIVAGSILPPVIMQRLEDELGLNQLTNQYGMTETSPISFGTIAREGFDRKTTTVGRIHPHVECKIIDSDGRIVERGVSGEILTRGYHVMDRYWNDKKKTDETIDAKGWVHTGDIGEIDEEGYLSLTGRLKDMIIRGAENISPKEIEQFFTKHSAVADIQVIAVKDDFMGEEVCAWIQLREHTDDPEKQAEIIADLQQYCKGNISHFKIPRYVKFVTEYPLTVSGKMKKNVMRDVSNDLLEKEDKSMIHFSGKNRK